MNERIRRHKRGVAITSSYCATPDADDDGFYPYYYQVQRTMGLKELYGHPEIEGLISFSCEIGGCSLARYFIGLIKEGARFKAGDRVELPYLLYGSPNCTVEFRELYDEHIGTYLRAVVLEIEEEYQALPSEKAGLFVESREHLIDPYE